MDDLNTKLDKIDDDKKLAYVLERAEVHSASEACKNADINRTAYYSWSEDEREYLNGLARELKLEVALKAKLVLRGATKEAAEVKVKGLTNRDERIKQSSATEILDRGLGKPVQKTETKHEVIKPVVVEHVLIHDEQEEEDEDTNNS